MNSSEQRAEFLAAFDENLKSGRSIPAANDDGAIGADPKITASMACLRALHSLWRPARSGPVVNPSSQLEGRRFGRLHIERPLGRGAFGEVTLAFDLELRRQVALKTSRADSVLTDDGRRRFLRDAQAAARLNHPGIVRAFDAGQIDNRCWIVSEYCQGGSLGQWIHVRAKPVLPIQAAELALQIALAVDCAHRNGILHRDLQTFQRPDRRLPREDRPHESRGIGKSSSPDTQTGGLWFGKARA